MNRGRMDSKCNQAPAGWRCAGSFDRGGRWYDSSRRSAKSLLRNDCTLLGYGKLRRWRDDLCASNIDLAHPATTCGRDVRWRLDDGGPWGWDAASRLRIKFRQRRNHRGNRTGNSSL
jgi:hypothetical protein